MKHSVFRSETWKGGWREVVPHLSFVREGGTTSFPCAHVWFIHVQLLPHYECKTPTHASRQSQALESQIIDSSAQLRMKDNISLLSIPSRTQIQQMFCLLLPRYTFNKMLQLPQKEVLWISVWPLESMGFNSLKFQECYTVFLRNILPFIFRIEFQP
jgi:hypothetical protein